MNINARLLPDAGGDLMSRYCSPRFSYARSCITRMPSSLALTDAPEFEVRSATVGIIRVVVIRNATRFRVGSFGDGLL